MEVLETEMKTTQKKKDTLTGHILCYEGLKTRSIKKAITNRVDQEGGNEPGRSRRQ